MKKFLGCVMLMTMLAGNCIAAEPAKFHIGVCTSTVSQGEDELRGAEELVRRYGDVTTGGMIKHVTYPDNFMTEQETTISQIASFADDPLCKAIIVNQAIPGTAEGFRRVRAKRPDILLFAADHHEDPTVISKAADLATNTDNLSRGYLIIVAAHKLGCDTFVHLSFPRHMSYELMSRRAHIMEQTCKDLGMKYYFETVPDPLSDVGIAGAQQYILEHVPTWIEKYGERTAFFCTNDAETEPLLKRIAEGMGYFIEADLPSPLMGYPGALGIDLSDVQGDFPAILKRVEDAVIERGGSGRMGTWPYSFGFTNTLAVAEYAKSLIEQGIDAPKFRRAYKQEDLIACLDASTPGATWNATAYTDVNTGVQLKNVVLMYQDTYIFGKGYLGMTKVQIPEKYFKIK